MAKIPNVNLVEQAIENHRIVTPLRPYLGYSIFGHQCARFLWYTFRWAYKKEITPRLQRLFNRGHQEEEVVVAELKQAGMQCRNVLEKQIEVVGFMGHIKGHPDGDILNVPGAEKNEHNLEIKTSNDKKFGEFVKFGVQRTSPLYYGQSNAYMHHKGQDRTLFIVTNKNNDYRHYERLHFNHDNFIELEERACDIITSPFPTFPKLSDRPEWYECKTCDAHGQCHMGEKLERNCRTCTESTIHDHGEWHCRVYPGKPIPVEFQRTGCENYYKSII